IVFPPPTVFDLCSGTNVSLTLVSSNVVVNGSCSTNITVVWKATDACSNSAICSQSIRIVDTLPPNLICASDKIVECGGGVPIAFLAPTAYDLCSGTNVTVTIVSTVTTPANPRCPGLTNITRTWSATDLCGNSNRCSQTITLVDTTPPDITCADNQIV